MGDDANGITVLKKADRKKWILASGALLITTSLILIALPEIIISLPNSRPIGDVIVILGGEPNYRPRLAAKLFHQGVSQHLIVTGRGDYAVLVRELVSNGVPLDSIQVEKQSATTFENAQNTGPLLDALHAKRVVLVTSWFHARRAKACFRHFRPDIEFVVATTPRQEEVRYRGQQWAYRELLKTAFYWVRYGISPFGR